MRPLPPTHLSVGREGQHLARQGPAPQAAGRWPPRARTLLTARGVEGALRCERRQAVLSASAQSLSWRSGRVEPLSEFPCPKPQRLHFLH